MLRAAAQDCMARIVPYNPFAFPPSMEVRCRGYDSREGGVRVASGTATESNVGNTLSSGELFVISY